MRPDRFANHRVSSLHKLRDAVGPALGAKLDPSHLFWRGADPVGDDGWLSIEREDVLLNSLEGLEKSVALLQGVMPAVPADYQPQDI